MANLMNTVDWRLAYCNINFIIISWPLISDWMEGSCQSYSMQIPDTGVGGGGGGACVPLPLIWLGGQWYVCAPPLLTPHFYFPLELYVCITLTNNYLAFFIYQLIILWTVSINWHRWLLLNNHISKYNSFILVLYRRYINYVSVCPPTFWHLPTPLPDKKSFYYFLAFVCCFLLCFFQLSLQVIFLWYI